MRERRVGFLKDPFSYRITGSCICCGSTSSRVVKLPYDQAIQFSQANSLFSKAAQEISKCGTCTAHNHRWEHHNLEQP